MLQRVAVGMVCYAVLMITPLFLQGQGLEKITEVEGITEYRLDNGIPVLIFPDNSKPNFTINMTVLVGSRHEGYGETGMAHLLEHMLFKGTDQHQDIPALLKERGVLNMNGTTWFDRTNYYETLPSSDENLEFAIRMEADRLLNSLIRGEDLASEMTVVRNEFEMGENSPTSILMQRIMATAYEWHNYGKSTIGNRSDIERVPVENLRAFYQKFYQPDNVMVVLAGQFDKDKALEYLQKYFGSLAKPNRDLPKTYTQEPIQDGERVVVLRRVGEVQMVGAGYHLPSAGHPDYAACEVLSTILGIEPSGRLYKSLVETQIASSVSTTVIPGHDPGMLLCFVEVPKTKDLEAARSVLISEIESLAEKKVADEEVKRAVQRLLKQREQEFSNSANTAINLSEWYAYGDWRLYFYFRDQLEKVTADDIQRVAQSYLLPSNRTVGLFYPTENPVRAKLPETIELKSLLADYKGREKIAMGEEFDPTPANIEARTIKGQLESGLKYAFLPKKTRGERVTLNGKVHFGNLESLQNTQAACDMLGSLMTRGTQNYSFEQFRDKLDEIKTSFSISVTPGTLNFSLQTKREHLNEALEMLRQALREPTLPSKEIEVLRTESITQMEDMKSDPQGLAFTEISRVFNQHDAADPRYSPSLDENIAWTKSVTAEEIQKVYAQLNGQHGELAIVGDFDAEETLPALEAVFANWTSEQAYERVPDPANTSVAGRRITINTPDKANAVYIAGQPLLMNDADPDYEAMLVGNYILGGGPLASRLADRVRKQEGLSYGVGSMFNADSVDQNAILIMFAISNPDNTEKVVNTITEEVERLLASGVENDELEKAKASYLETRKGGRSNDGQLASALVTNLETGRTMDFQESTDAKIELLTKEKVDSVLKKLVDPKQTVIVTAGDFEKAKQAESNSESKTDDKE